MLPADALEHADFALLLPNFYFLAGGLGPRCRNGLVVGVAVEADCVGYAILMVEKVQMVVRHSHSALISIADMARVYGSPQLTDAMACAAIVAQSAPLG
jgi:hypothetical protein